MKVMIQILFALINIGARLEELQRDVKALRREVKELRDSLEHPDLRAMIITVGTPTEE